MMHDVMGESGAGAPEFSVIVPTYDRAAFLREALASVTAQTHDNWECLVVDDASPTPPTLPDDARFRLIRRDENGGPAKARNTGLDMARGRYVAFLDDDDAWAPHRLEDALDAHLRADVVVCWQGELGTVDGTTPGRRLDGDVADSILDEVTPHLGATTITRSSAPRFDEGYWAADDVDWWIVVASQRRVTTVPRVGLWYRYHSQQRERTSQANRVLDGYRLLERHESYFASHPRAKAVRYKRMGLSAIAAGDRAQARRLFVSSLRARAEPRTAWHLLRSCSPSGR
jgi:glycosyltransferase involved in cell wall biosynthesis